MEGTTMNLNNSPLVRGMGSQDAEAVREVNFSNAYYKMLNKYGREVPVAVELEADKLKRGYVHTDKKVYSDDMSKRVHAPLPVTPMEVMAKLAEKMIEDKEGKDEKEESDLSKKPFFTLKKLAKEAGMDVEGKTKTEILEFLNK